MKLKHLLPTLQEAQQIPFCVSYLLGWTDRLVICLYDRRTGEMVTHEKLKEMKLDYDQAQRIAYANLERIEPKLKSIQVTENVMSICCQNGTPVKSLGALIATSGLFNFVLQNQTSNTVYIAIAGEDNVLVGDEVSIDQLKQVITKNNPTRLVSNSDMYIMKLRSIQSSLDEVIWEISDNYGGGSVSNC
jgi:hypothetical protein